MTEAERLNQVLARHAPALARCLSPLGRQVAFPQGIPFQAAAARGTRLNATIGQVTDGAGSPLPLPSLADTVPGLDRKMSFLYSPQPGHASLRTAWRERQMLLAGVDKATCSLPFATHGLTHGLSLVADLFADPDTTVIIPTPSWGNYKLLFTMRAGAQLVTYPFFRDGRFNLEGLSDAMDAAPGKIIVILNFPSNPTGYSPTPEEADRIAARVAAHTGPAVWVCDDAYQGVVHEPGLLDHSLYWRVAQRVDPERGLVVKIDGATKELMFFPSRVGFLSASIPQEAEAAWTSKLNCLVRGSVGSPPGPSQAMMMVALTDHQRTQREFTALRDQLSGRYRALRDAVDATDNPHLVRFPFNAAYFALIGLSPQVSPEAVRLRLIEERSVGVIAIRDVNALRIAYCSTRAEDLPEIVGHIDDVVRQLAG